MTKPTVNNDIFYDYMRSERSRLDTFHGFKGGAVISPASLAAAGFFYSGIGSRVECAFCRGSIEEWTKRDDPVEVHRKKFPHCLFIKGHLSSTVPENTRSADLTQPKSGAYQHLQSLHDQPTCFTDCLVQSREPIVKNLQYVDDIVEHLADEYIAAISQDQCEDILSESRKIKKIGKLLTTLNRRGEEGAKQFFVALHITEQGHLCPIPSGLQIDITSDQLDILSCDKFKTQLVQQYERDIERKNKLEDEMYGNVIHLDQHEPVVITQDKNCPDEHLRRGFNEFIVNKSDEKVVTFREIFKLSTGQKRDRSFLLLGRPGSGKTSLCFTILNLFVNKRWLDEHEVIIFLTLKMIEDLPDLSVTELLLHYGGVEVPADKKHRVMEQLKNRQKRMLLVFDGYDEVSPFLKDEHLSIKDHEAKAKPLSIVANIIHGNLFPESQILITSRPYDMGHIRTDRVHEIGGLKEESIESLMRQVFPSDVFEDMTRFLAENNDVMSLLAMPVNLQKFLAYIKWLAEEQGDIKHLSSLYPKTKSAIYSSQIYPILKQCLRRQGIVKLGRQKMWREPFVKQHLLRLCKLASLALEKLGKRQIVFDEHDLDICELSDELVKVCGFMTSFIQMKRTRDGVVSIVRYIFTHLTNLEWVGGFHVIGTPEKFNEIVSGNIGQFDAILNFAVGLLRHADGQQMIECIYNMSKETCDARAKEMFSDIISSKRCNEGNGPQFCLELFFEGQFTDPTQILQQLCPQPNVLEISGINLLNKSAVRYFFSKVSEWYSDQPMTAFQRIWHLKLQFNQEVDIPVIRGMLDEAVRLQQLRTIEFSGAGILHLQSSSPYLTTASFVVKQDMNTDALTKTLNGICTSKCCRLLQIYKPIRQENNEEEEQAQGSDCYKKESSAHCGPYDTAHLELCGTEDEEVVKVALDCLTRVNRVKKLDVKDAELRKVMMCEEIDDPHPGLYLLTLFDKTTDPLTKQCIQGLHSSKCLVLQTSDQVPQAKSTTLHFHFTNDNIRSLAQSKGQLADDNAASRSSFQPGNKDDHIYAHDIVRCATKRFLGNKNCILVDIGEIQTNEVGREIAQVSEKGPLEMVFLKGKMDNDIMKEHLSKMATETLCIVNTRVFDEGAPLLPSTTHKCLSELHVRLCHLQGKLTSSILVNLSSLRALSQLRYNKDTSSCIHNIIARCNSLTSLGLYVFSGDTSQLVSALSKLRHHLTCLVLGLTSCDLACEVLRGLDLKELWLTFLESAHSAEKLRKMSDAVSNSQSLRTISLLGLQQSDMQLFVDNIRGSHLKTIYITNRASLDTRRVNFSGKIISLDTGETVLSRFFCPLVHSDFLLTNVPHQTKQLLKTRYVKPRLIYHDAE